MFVLSFVLAVVASVSPLIADTAQVSKASTCDPRSPIGGVEAAVDATLRDPISFQRGSTEVALGYVEYVENSPATTVTSEMAIRHRIYLQREPSHRFAGDTYACYRICMGRGQSYGAVSCQSDVTPQPAIGEIHADEKDRVSYNLLIDGVRKETAAEADYAVIALWLQEVRDPTPYERALFEAKVNRVRGGPLMVGDTYEALAASDRIHDRRFNPMLPTMRFELRYRFLAAKTASSQFQATEETLAALKRISDVGRRRRTGGR